MTSVSVSQTQTQAPYRVNFLPSRISPGVPCEWTRGSRTQGRLMINAAKGSRKQQQLIPLQNRHPNIGAEALKWLNHQSLKYCLCFAFAPQAVLLTGVQQTFTADVTYCGISIISEPGHIYQLQPSHPVQQIVNAVFQLTLKALYCIRLHKQEKGNVFY